MRFSRDVIFDDFGSRLTASQKSQMSATLADNLIPMNSFGRGQRERRCAREEKEEGLLRTVDCILKS